MGDNINVIFYSRKCNNCKNLLNLLKNENLLGYFVLFCVDGRLNEIPSHITVVPTMIVSNVNKPLVGAETFNWVNKTKFLRQQNLMSENKNIIMKQNLMNANNNDKIDGYEKDVMNGISDSFAFTKKDVALPHSYVGVNNDQISIFTAPEQGKINKDEQKKKINDIKKMRENQDSHYSEIMKKQQIHAVLQSENEKINNPNRF